MPLSPTYPYLRVYSFFRKFAAPSPHKAAAKTGARSHMARAGIIHLRGSNVLRVSRIAEGLRGGGFRLHAPLNAFEAGGGPVRRTRHFILIAMLSPAVLFGCATTETIADKPVQNEYILNTL